MRLSSIVSKRNQKIKNSYIFIKSTPKNDEIALLRILMPDINIAATTALQSIDANGRLRAIEYGANVLMPNITPKKYRDDYFLYQNKPLASQSDEDELKNLAHSLKSINHTIGLRAQGNSLRFGKR